MCMSVNGRMYSHHARGHNAVCFTALSAVTNTWRALSRLRMPGPEEELDAWLAAPPQQDVLAYILDQVGGGYCGRYCSGYCSI